MNEHRRNKLTRKLARLQKELGEMEKLSERPENSVDEIGYQILTEYKKELSGRIETIEAEIATL